MIGVPAALAFALLLLARSGHSGSIEQDSQYQACMSSPSTCISLALNGQQLTGTIPTELGMLSRLTWLDVDVNRLTGTVPSELGSATSLVWLCFHQNQLTGTVPSELGLLTSLTWLRFYTNQLSGTIPSELGALSRLTTLVVCNNIGLCGDIPASVTLTTQICSNPTTGTRLGLACPSSAPSASPSMSPTTSAPTGIPTQSPTSSPTEHVTKPEHDKQPLKDNWFRKRDVARKKAFPQLHSWRRKHEKANASFASNV
mmetsp:Transcript_249/g.427  ORF Transcript_249/g.427 Transcript_249/m.427 type:complete len:257 (+) Transcript_249:95-865(+)|eukprot:CAMPEP_0114246288 /NCGR_PEP_ID=MMETSP0058-20121206/12375_1 /TAXON_ID=36894 /ORGANISM="Pyramimonas parkeae, CCMP726" /LENGTH=256 /DNA_ID=CAMNT_0001359449 /DNA_START=63 /DNA_END=833 /DNA_ORIENTATION=-